MKLRAQVIFPVIRTGKARAKRIIKPKAYKKKENCILDLIQKIWYNLNVLKRKGE